ncbi:hypothetical protein Ade02nite_59380 [Paractinoplanes deccanensis]|uniref:O-antigen ligase-related domain-containing protein n=1 Tax=Paractinoplanes deccanensis TaxID=113561 RepID=A0ABQ3YB88_9ACTN|nr:O-antigen ligase family protein [Actinoplanes deccanensis]GID77297.1 hypothetical protein Ade02nite_59380 [Actinoplanes deccanensis]
MSTQTLHPLDLEPSLLHPQTYATRRFVRVDAATVLCVMVALLLVIPAWLIVPGMTDIGRPGLVVGLVLWFWWMLARLNPRLVLVGPQPIRWAVLAYGLSLIVSYAVGYLRGLTAMEANGADRAMIFAGAFTGVILMTADGVRNWARLRRLLAVLVTCAAFVGLVAIIQFVTRDDITRYLSFPGLEVKGVVPDFQYRGAAIRVASTTTHYIELSMVMVTVLPFAIHLARYAQTSRMRQVYAFAALLIAGAIPATVSRTGFLALAIVLLCLTPMWTWRYRYNMIVTAGLLVAAAVAAKPSLTSTVFDMFASAEEDSSITARTERYEMVAHYFNQRPWFGRGTGTWIYPMYQYLDNQWLSHAVSNGLVGVAALAALHITAITLAVLALRRATRPADKDICAALVATQLVAVLGSATFDSFAFTTYTCLLAVMVGLCGTVWRFTHPARAVRTAVASGLVDEAALVGGSTVKK